MLKKKYCLYLNNGINFHYSGLTYCNKLWQDHSFQKYEQNYLKIFFEKRESTLSDAKDGIYPEHCQKCLYLKEVDENFHIDDKIKFIEIYHWNQCNCACVYCSNRETTKLEISKGRKHKGVINLLDNLKELQKQDRLSKNVEISLVGGEPTILHEFPKLLKFFIKNKYTVNILSNGIFYEKYITKTIKTNPNSSICISLDCASKENFKKIKGVDEFDNVVKNIKRYIKDTKDLSNKVIIKYIILKGLNDTKEEIDNWIKLCISIGVTNFFPSIEFCHSVKNPEKSELTQEICDLYEYMKSKIKEYNSEYTISTYDFVEDIIKNHSYKIR